ncbi:MAG: ABC transporter substrate-binding protein [Methanomassiliicoccaceae archaeon]|nr:ABC transporter substrate-binding protein [Methanomassiliicoccaceae archaeon]
MEPIRLKVILSAVIISSGAFMVLVVGAGASATAYQAQGLAIDFGEGDVVWTDADLHNINDPVELLMFACAENGFSCDISGDTVTEIDGVASNTEREWDFWVIDKGETEWRKVAPPYDLDMMGHTSYVWAYCGVSERPAVGADQAGNSIFGYARPQRAVSLAPSITEILGSLNAVSVLVGTDKYSNYPRSVTEGQQRGDIKIIGDWQNPSYELIMGTNPDMVFCDGSQYSHYEMSERLRRSDVPTVVLYSGESIETILNNIYIIGRTLQYDLRAQSVKEMLNGAQEEIITKLMSGNTKPVDTMISLSPDKSPWVSGRYTYVDDIMGAAFGRNAMPDSFYGWVHATSSIISSSNPSVIIIFTYDYQPTESEYNEMLSTLSGEWKYTDAYKNGQIYMFCDDLAEMASRPGPRYAQLMELIAMILHPDVFSTSVPKYIGNDYVSYLTITDSLGFNV